MLPNRANGLMEAEPTHNATWAFDSARMRLRGWLYAKRFGNASSTGRFPIHRWL